MVEKMLSKDHEPSGSVKGMSIGKLICTEVVWTCGENDRGWPYEECWYRPTWRWFRNVIKITGDD